MELILANFAGSMRRETLNGKEYLVVPLTMIVNDVLSGSNGPLYYPEEEFVDGSGWNHMPIVVNHPFRRGRPTSARQPDIINATGIGYVFDAKPSLTGKALVAEGWFDVEATKRINPGIYNDLEAGRQIELSTGLQADYEKAPSGASFNGKAYRYIVRNMRPDHLAVLPDQVGACSLTMGCGVHVTTNTATDAKDGFTIEMVDELDKVFISNLSEGEGFERVLENGKQRFKTWKKKETLNNDDKTTIWQKLGTLLGITSNGKVPEPDSQSGLSTTNNEEPDMAKLTENDRPKLIKELTTNCDCWDAKKDADTLKAFSLDKLSQLVNHSKDEAANRELVESVKDGITDTAGAKLSFNVETNKWEAEAPAKPVKETVNKKADDTGDDTSNLTPEQEEDLKWARNERAKKRTRLITKLVANFDLDERAERSKKLMKKPLSELEELLEFTSNAGPGDDDDDDDDDDDYQDTRNKGRKRKPGRYAGTGRVANSDQSDDDDLINNLLVSPTLEFGDTTGDLRKRLEASRSAS